MIASAVASFVFRLLQVNNRSRGAMAREKNDFIKRQRVKKSALFDGNVQRQWK
jgi:hypothetical protein